jgi:hypothetical protein
MNTATFKLDKRVRTKEMPYAYRKGEKRIRAKRVRQDGKSECRRQLCS